MYASECKVLVWSQGPGPLAAVAAVRIYDYLCITEPSHYIARKIQGVPPCMFKERGYAGTNQGIVVEAVRSRSEKIIGLCALHGFQPLTIPVMENR